MKSFQLFILGLSIIATFALSAVAQKEKRSVVLTKKIAVFDSNAFEDKQSGIKELVVVYDKLDVELKPKYDELNRSPVKVILEEIYKELLLKKEILEKHTVGCLDPKFIQRIEARFDEYNRLHSEYEKIGRAS